MKTRGDILKQIHYEIFGASVGKCDVVSGIFHLKLLRAYRAYDKRQKQVLISQQETIDRLSDENNSLRKDLDGYIDIFNQVVVNCRSRDIVSRQRAQIAQLLSKQASLKEEIRQLKSEYGKSYTDQATT